MSDLLVIEFPKSGGRAEMRLAVQKEYPIELGDAAIAVREASGRIKLNQLFQPVAHGRQRWKPRVDLRSKVTPTLVKES